MPTCPMTARDDVMSVSSQIIARPSTWKKSDWSTFEASSAPEPARTQHVEGADQAGRRGPVAHQASP